MQFSATWAFLDILQLSKVVNPICIWFLHSSSGLGHIVGNGLSLDTLPFCPTGFTDAPLLPENQHLERFPLGFPEPPGKETDRKVRSQCPLVSEGPLPG